MQEQTINLFNLQNANIKKKDFNMFSKPAGLKVIMITNSKTLTKIRKIS